MYFIIKNSYFIIKKSKIKYPRTFHYPPNGGISQKMFQFCTLIQKDRFEFKEEELQRIQNDEVFTIYDKNKQDMVTFRSFDDEQNKEKELWFVPTSCFYKYLLLRRVLVNKQNGKIIIDWVSNHINLQLGRRYRVHPSLKETPDVLRNLLYSFNEVDVIIEIYRMDKSDLADEETELAKKEMIKFIQEFK